MAFAQAAHDLGALSRLGCDNSYTLARLVQIIGNFMGGTLSLGVDLLKRLNHDNLDNGLFVINQTHDADGKVTLTQYPRGLNLSAKDLPSLSPEPRIVFRDSVSTHPYWFNKENGVAEEMLTLVKERNAAPFGGWKEAPATK
jgi:hypothetical protein